MAVAPQRRDQIHILRPGAPPAGGIHIVSGADNDDNQIFVDTSEMPDGGLRIMYGSPEADEDGQLDPRGEEWEGRQDSPLYEPA